MAFNDSDDLLAQKAEQRMAQALATARIGSLRNVTEIETEDKIGHVG
ncbi:hypothetical protein ISX56_34125, partial [Serratia ureilytica]|nr:hypothetical protein [Serratia ureilytica]